VQVLVWGWVLRERAWEKERDADREVEKGGNMEKRE
jgi:hypothetical protein